MALSTFIHRLANAQFFVGILLISCSKSGETDSGDSENTPDTQETAKPVDEWQIKIVSPTSDDVFDECEPVCVTVQLLHHGEGATGVPGQLEIENFGVFTDGKTDGDGLLRGCASGLDIGKHNLAASFFNGTNRHNAYEEFSVAPFGLSYGVEKPVDVLSSPPFVPQFTRSPNNPVLSPGENGDWDSAGLLTPTVVTDDDHWTMYFSGTTDVDFQIGGAVGADTVTWSKFESNPVLSATLDEGWRAYATESPAALYDDGLYKVWFNGRSTENEGLSIGLATSVDGETFTDTENNPLIIAEEEWEAEALTHPTVIKNGALYEMWYATNTLQMGYAISEDGLSWTKYCNNPVMAAEKGASWEAGEVKSPEVLFDGEYYLMAYSAGGHGNWSIGWAMSHDGIRWAKHTAPILAPSETDSTSFESQSVFGSPMVLQETTLHLWYAGISLSESGGIGYANSSWTKE